MATDSLFCKIYILIGPRDLISKRSIQNVIDLVLNVAVKTDLNACKILLVTIRSPFCTLY